MTARIITVFNQKGGVGKTTVALNSAGTLGLRGHKVLLVDLDDQGTLSISTGQAADDKPFPATTVSLSDHPKPQNEIRKFLNDYDFIVIDCPPAIRSKMPSTALLISDLGIIPVGASGGSLWATGRAIELAQEAQTLNPALQYRTLANQEQNTAVIRDTFAQLAEMEAPMFKTRLGYRNAFKEAEVLGMPVPMFAGKRHAATVETNALVDEILEVLEGGE